MIEIEIVKLVFYGFGIFALGVALGATFAAFIIAVALDRNE